MCETMVYKAHRLPFRWSISSSASTRRRRNDGKCDSSSNSVKIRIRDQHQQKESIAAEARAKQDWCRKCFQSWAPFFWIAVPWAQQIAERLVQRPFDLEEEAEQLHTGGVYVSLQCRCARTELNTETNIASAICLQPFCSFFLAKFRMGLQKGYD